MKMNMIMKIVMTMKMNMKNIKSISKSFAY